MIGTTKVTWTSKSTTILRDADGKTVRKTTHKEFDDEGRVKKETIILDDGGLGEAEAKKRLSRANKFFDSMGSLFQRMEDLLDDLIKVFTG